MGGPQAHVELRRKSPPLHLPGLLGPNCVYGCDGDVVFVYICLVFLVTHQDPQSSFIPQMLLVFKMSRCATGMWQGAPGIGYATPATVPQLHTPCLLLVLNVRQECRRPLVHRSDRRHRAQLRCPVCAVATRAEGSAGCAA